jgi:hypothetical protein
MLAMLVRLAMLARLARPARLVRWEKAGMVGKGWKGGIWCVLLKA